MTIAIFLSYLESIAAFFSVALVFFIFGILIISGGARIYGIVHDLDVEFAPPQPVTSILFLFFFHLFGLIGLQPNNALLPSLDSPITIVFFYGQAFDVFLLILLCSRVIPIQLISRTLLFIHENNFLSNSLAFLSSDKHAAHRLFLDVAIKEDIRLGLGHIKTMDDNKLSEILAFVSKGKYGHDENAIKMARHILLKIDVTA